MSDARLGQGIMLQIPLKTFPGERALLTTPVNPLESQLRNKVPINVIGDAKKVGKAQDAIRDAYFTAIEI